MIKKNIYRGTCLLICMMALHLTCFAQDNRIIFISNLKFNMGESEMNEMFGKFGEIEKTYLAKDRETGRSRGFGFVTMKTVEDANKIIKVADNFEFEGRKLVVEPFGKPGLARSPISSNTQATTSGVGYSGGYNKQRW